MNAKNYSGFLLGLMLFASVRLIGQETKITAFDAAFADLFGYTVAIDGNYAIVGAPLQGGFGTQNAGAAYVFQLRGGSWVYMAKLTPPWGGSFGDQFGTSVDISGNYAIVGAPRSDHSNKSDAGVAYVYATNGTQWYPVATLRADDPDNQDYFGNSVGVNDGGVAVVGVAADDDQGASSGSAYIYEPHYSNWIQVAKITASDAHSGDAFGTDVAIDGSTVVVGAPANIGVHYLQSGAIYVFEPHYGHWSQTARLTHSIADVFDHLGQSVDIEGNYIIAGAPFANDKTGDAYIFYRTGPSWSQEAKLSPSDGAPHDKFGWSVGITSGHAVVGSYLDDDLGSESGSVYIFEQAGTLWSELVKRNAFDGAGGDRLGNQVDIDGTYAIGGAPYHDGAATESGAAYIFGPSLAAIAPCQSNMVLQGMIDPGIYHASDFIQAEGIISATASVVLSGTNYVALMPQLEVMQGGVLEINLAGCP
ncbi:MAG: FG-GAP repeat protein [Saprospiraceae bacterium]|nr:FG-GAP repeat protein [Saprospiraceae bacterium]